MNTTEIIALARANYRITTKNPYVNSWFEAPKGFWDGILSNYAPRLAKKDSSKRAPNKTTIAKIVILYGHIVANYAARQGKNPVPMSCGWLDKHLIRIPIKDLTAKGTGIKLVSRYKRPFDGVKGLCSKIKPLPEIMNLLNADGEIMTVREFLKSHGFDTRRLKFSGIKSLSIQDLIVAEGWLSSVPAEYSTPVVSVPSLGKGSVSASSALWECDSASVISAPTTIRSQTYHEGLIRLDLDAAYRQLETYSPEKQAIYRPPLDFIRKHTDKDGYYCCRYKPFSFFGRYFEFGGGIQALKRDIRQALLQSELDTRRLFNYDIAKCQANGLLQVFRHLKLETGPLEGILDRFDTVCDDLGIPKELMKTAIYAGVWDGSLGEFRKNRGQPVHTDVAEAFMDQYESPQEALEALARVREYLKPLTSEIRKARKLLGIPLGAVLTQLEQAYIHTIVVLCERSGIHVVSLQHDGIMTDKPIPEELMRSAADLSGFERARLVAKPFAEIETFHPEAVWEILEGIPA